MVSVPVSPTTKVAEEFFFVRLSSGLERNALVLVSFHYVTAADGALSIPQWTGSGVHQCVPSGACSTPLLRLLLREANYFDLRE